MSVNRVWRWLKTQVAQEVPDDYAACAFDCKKTDCSPEQIATCERRLQHGISVCTPREANACLAHGAPAPHE